MDPTARLTRLPAHGGRSPAARAPHAPPGKARRASLAAPASAVPGSLACSALAVLVAVAVGGCVSAPHEIRFEEQSHLTLDVAPQTKLVVDNPRGTVRLEPSASAQLQLDARKRTAARSMQEARELAREIRVEAVREGRELRIVVTYPEHVSQSHVRVQWMGHDLARRRANVDLVIGVPPKLATQVVTKSGDLTVEGTADSLEFWTISGDGNFERHAGPLVIRSTSGDMTAGRLDGPLVMSTTSGDLHVDQVTGPLHYESTSGDLTAADVGGDLAVAAISGDVEVDRVRGPARVSTTSGDVELGNASGVTDVVTASGDVVAHIEQALQRVSVETTSGDVSLELPDSPAGRLDVVTASGEVTAKLPMTLEQATRRRLVGVMGPGPATVAIHTSSGDVHVGLASER